MAELFFFSIVETILRKLGSIAVQQIGEAVGATKELDKLHNTLETIQAVCLDADQRLHHQMNNQVKVWLQRLKDVCSRAEDVLDDVEIAALQQQLIQERRRRNVRKKVSHFFSSSNPVIFRYKMSHKIKEIREELDAIAADRHNFHTTTPNQNRESNRIVPEWRDTHSSPTDIIGREEDIELLVNVSMQMDPNSNNNSVDVVTIVGIGGLGKTALAKSLYNDQRVKDHFQLQKWVCVGEIFEAKTIIGKIVDKDLNNMEQSVKALKETMSGKRYLLILDDVWNEEVEKWNALMELFMLGNEGSKIIVTTRLQSIAKFTSTNYTHTLGGLSEKDSISLLLKQALGKGQVDRFPDLIKIGKDIVKKCKGVPLAIRTLGGVLYMKTDKKEWCWVRDDKLLNLIQKESGILPVLELSFIHLPSYLKPCFSFCSLFDKDTEYNTEDMIGTWMALGYLQSGKSKSQLEAEDIGLDYFKKLWSKSFFQDVEEDRFRLGHYRFKMHDLMHDLAISLGKGEYASITPEVESIVASDHSQKVRHLAFPSLTDDSVKRGVPKSIVKQKGLRSIIVEGDFLEGVNSYELFITSISEFKYLRVLVFKFTGLEVIPSSIGGLKHLRLLCLRGNKSIKTLPDSVCKLVGLQTLDVTCEGLERLPKDIRELINLRTLYLTTQQQNFSHQTGGECRGGIASLSSLRLLCLFGSRNLESLFDLSLLTHLRTLEIHFCNRLKSLPPTLRNLRRLETLSIFSCEDLDMTRMMTNNEQLTENMGGPDGSGDGLTSLRSLYIIGIPKLVNIPNWLLHCVSLQYLEIRYCTNMTSLLGTTPYRLPPTLQKLTIHRCGRLNKRCAGKVWHYISHIPNIIIDEVRI